MILKTYSPNFKKFNLGYTVTSVLTEEFIGIGCYNCKKVIKNLKLTVDLGTLYKVDLKDLKCPECHTKVKAEDLLDFRPPSGRKFKKPNAIDWWFTYTILNKEAITTESYPINLKQFERMLKYYEVT